jgi:hypothetical protein
MTRKLPRSAFYSIKSPEHFYTAMGRDVKLLREHVSYTTCTTVVLCCIDAMAAGSGEANRGSFATFVNEHFPALCADLDGTVPGKSGAEVLYSKFRNGFAHLRGPKSGFAIAEDHELEGRYAGEIEVEGIGKFVAINVDRLINDFLRVVDDLGRGAA